MKDAIGYLRVSTREQGRSGLGLEAQRKHIEEFGDREGFKIRAWHQDVQTGAGADALLLRPALALALKGARTARCPLIVSRLDRLSRNVHFISGLMEHKVHFVVAALGRDCDEFTLHIYASLAEQERKMIAERTKAGLAAAKARGVKLGMAARSMAYRRRVNARSVASILRAAAERAEAQRPNIVWALRLPGRHGRPISFLRAARALNERGVPSPKGRHWSGDQVKLTSDRLGLHHPPGQLSPAALRTRAHAVWQKDTDFTGKKLIASFGLQYPLGIQKARKLMRECRLTVAKRCSLYTRTGWRIDRYTAARVRIAEIWRRHPDLTAKKITEILKPEYVITQPWVRYVMQRCWRTSASYRPGFSRNGRRLRRPRRHGYEQGRPRG